MVAAATSIALPAATAFAQEPPAPAAAAPAAAAPAAAPVETKDGARFRGGVSAVAGTMAVSGYSGFLGGVDGRLGVQVNNLLGLYLMPHMSFGPVKAGGGVSTAIGVLSATALADVTLADRFFVGAGGGFGVVNNPSGAVIHFRAGGYPVMGHGENGIRRKGLMLGADARFYLLSGATVMQIMGGLGYEAF